jgi:uncharacterized protein YndB with AHSA1/START domain
MLKNCYTYYSAEELERSMNLLKKSLIAFSLLFAVVFVVGFALPSEFKVERSISINGDAKQVYRYLADLREWRKWGLWFQLDPDMRVVYSGPEQAVGMRSAWESESQGSGEMELIALDPNRRIIYTLYFPEFDMKSTGELIITQQRDQIQLRWMNYGNIQGGPLNNYFALVMDSMIGPDFEAGLSNLKQLVEDQE